VNIKFYYRTNISLFQFFTPISSKFHNTNIGTCIIWHTQGPFLKKAARLDFCQILRIINVRFKRGLRLIMKKKVLVFTFIFMMISSNALLFLSFSANDADLYRINFNNKSTGFYGYYIKNTPYLPVSIIGSYASNPGIIVDTANQRLNINLAVQNIMMADEQTTNFIKTYAGTVYIPLIKIDDNLYFPLNTTQQFFKISYNVSGNEINLRAYSGKVSNIDLASLDFYAPKKNKWKQGASKINLAWQYVDNVTPEAPPKYNGLDIISPTWFHLITNGDGSVENNGDKGYTDVCHEKGYMVWATITNNMSTKGSTNFTTQTFSNAALLNRSVAQYIFYSCLYDVDGINIDYEDVIDSDAAGLVNFTRIMRDYTERQGLVLSIDTLIPKPWTIEYDRKALAKYVDYLAVMTYDEHYSSSPQPGSISSIPWTEQAIKDTIAEGVPASQILLGVPLYTRVWCIDSDGKIVSNKSASMMFMQTTSRKKN